MNKIFLAISFDIYNEGECILAAFNTRELASKWVESYKHNGIFYGDEGFYIRELNVNEEYIDSTYKCSDCDYTTTSGSDNHECTNESYLEELDTKGVK